MGPDEQVAIIGKTVLEQAELQRDLAVMDKTLRDLSACFANFAKGLSLTTAESPVESIVIPDGVREYADLSKVVDLIRCRFATYHRLQNIRHLLKQMGV